MLVVLVFSVSASLTLAGMNASRGDVIALVGEENGNFDRLDITTGVTTVIKNNGTVYEGLAYNANESVLYGIVSAAFLSPTSLVTINPTTGVDTLVGANGINLTTITNLADGRLFGVDANDVLYQINPATGAATKIGATGLPVLSGIGFDNSLASNGTTLYYTLDTGGGNSTLYTLSLTTGAATAVGPTGMTGIVGSAFAGPTFLTGQLYGFTNSGQTDVINLTTGAATPLNSNGITDIFGGVGVVTSAAVPEPSTFALVGIFGVMGVVGTWGRRKGSAA
jgi:uncharacterized protein DUF4394/PEP-CTERM motif-containing protein